MEYLKKVLQRQKKLEKVYNKKVYFANILIFLFILFVSIYYIFQVNSIIDKGYKLKDLQIQISELENQAERLKLQIVNLQSIQNITARAKNLGLIPVEEKEFVNLNSNQVAKK